MHGYPQGRMAVSDQLIAKEREQDSLAEAAFVRMRPLGGAWPSSKSAAQVRGPPGSPEPQSPDPAFMLLYRRQNLDHRSSSFLSPWDVWGHMRTKLGWGRGRGVGWRSVISEERQAVS